MLLRGVLEHFKTQNWNAVGLDLAIVVLGILLAFQIDSWSEYRRSQLAASSHLTGLAEDLVENQAELKRVISLHYRALKGAQQLLQIDANASPPLTHEQFYQLLREVMFWPTLSVTRETYDRLIATGQFELIGDDELRQAPVKFYTYADSRVREDLATRNGGQSFENYVTEEFDSIAVLKMAHPEETESFALSQESNVFLGAIGTEQYKEEFGDRWHIHYHAVRGYRQTMEYLMKAQHLVTECVQECARK
jgi:hypothetical protein